MRKALFKTMMYAGVTGMLLSGCTNDDLYNPEAVVKKYEQNWEKQFGQVDPEQTWNTAKQVTANISINEDALSEYIFQIYTGNPLGGKNAYLIAEKIVTTDAQGAASVKMNIDVPSALSYFYVSRIDNHGRRVVKVANYQNNMLSASFGNSGTQTRASVTEVNLPTMESPYTETQVNGFINEGYDLSQGLDSKNEWAGPTTVSDFNKIAMATNNTKNSTIAVIKTEYTGTLQTNNSGNKYYTKEEITTDWGASGYKEVEHNANIGDVKLVIADKGSYTLSGNVWNMDIIVANGATLYINNKIYMGDNARIIIMHGGRIIDRSSSDWSIDHNAGSALIYNAGSIEASKILLNSATLYNAKDGIMELTEISFQNDNCVLTNYGKISVGSIGGNNEQGTINNGCLLRSDKQIQVKYLNQAANTSIECEYISFYELTLRANSILRTNRFRANNTNIQYVGSGNPALISATNIDYVNEGNFKISGNIYFEADTYSDNKENNQYGGYWKTITDAITEGNAGGLSRVGEAPVTIIPGNNGEELATADCVGKGNKPTDTPTPTPDPNAIPWIIACEDLGNTDDFDFNDIVFSVSHVAGNTKATVTPLAAGGVLASDIYFGSQRLGEIHSLLGQSGLAITNTQSGRGSAGKPIEVTVPADFSIATNMGGFSIQITDENGNNTTAIHAPQNGTAPQMICIDGSTNWAWPMERVKISDAYPGFGEWGASYQSNADWYKSAEKDKVVK